jgi:hypothetical protein
LKATIRLAQVSNSITVVGWFTDHAAAQSWGGPAVPDPLIADWLKQEIADPSHVYRTTVSDEDVVLGFYGFRLYPSEGRGHVRRLATAPDIARRVLAGFSYGTPPIWHWPEGRAD